MFLTIDYHLTFENSERKKYKIDVHVVNHQVGIYYNDYWNKAALHRVINDEEHEVISMISHYLGMGYKMTYFKRKRVTTKSWEEIIKERSNYGEN